MIQKLKLTLCAVEKISIPLSACKNYFFKIHISKSNENENILTGSYERSILKFIESFIIQKSIFLIVGSFSQIKSYTKIRGC